MIKPLRVIVIGLGSAGDVHPNAGLALALEQRGHQVLLVAPVIFQPLAERLGLEFAGIFSEEAYLAAIRDPDLWHPIRAFSVMARRMIVPSIRPIYEIIAKRMEPGRTVVVAPGTAFGARIAQEKLGVPLVTVHLQPTMFRSVIQPCCYTFPDVFGRLPRPLRRLFLRALDRFMIDPPLAKETNGLRVELGLPPVQRFFDRWMHSPQLVLGLFPDWFAPPAPDWPPNVVLTGFPLWDEREVRAPMPALAEFLDAGDPPIVFTAGSAMTQAKHFFEVSAEVCQAAGWRGIFLTQFAEQLPARLPEGVCHFDYVPFSAVLPRAAVLVHYGGIGTSAQGMAAGVPHLVVPAAFDQPDNAARIHRLGLGEFLLPKEYRKPNVIARLKRLMAPEVRERCEQRARRLRATQTLETSCRLIEDLT